MAVPRAAARVAAQALAVTTLGTALGRLGYPMILLLTASLLGPATAAQAARPIFELRDVPRAEGLTALADGSVIGTSEGGGTWRLPSMGGLVRLSSFQGGRDVAVDRAGNVHLSQGDRVVRLTADGDAVPVLTGLNSPSGLSFESNGALLVAETSGHRVLRLAEDGSVTTVAGTGEQGFSGDGGSATDARLGFVRDVAATPDGGFLVAQPGAARIRKVAPDGIIRTVAGTGEGAPPRQRGPATQVGIGSPASVVAGRHGGFAVFGGWMVRVVNREGMIRSVAGRLGGEPQPGLGSGIFNGDGGSAHWARIGYGGALAITPSDDYIIASGGDSNTLRLAPSRATPRLAIGARALLPARRRLSYMATRPATVRLELRSRQRPVVLRQQIDSKRHGSFRFPRSLPAGAYFVRLSARAADGQHSEQQLGMIYGHRLTPRIARLALLTEETNPLVTPRGVNRTLRPDRGRDFRTLWGPCRRMSRLRIDCRETDLHSDGTRECILNHAVLLDRRLGQLGLGSYLCGRFRRRALADDPPFQLPLLEPFVGVERPLLGIPPRRPKR